MARTSNEPPIAEATRLTIHSLAAWPAATRTSRDVCPAKTSLQMSRSRFASRPAICQWSRPEYSGRTATSSTYRAPSNPHPQFQISFDHSTYTLRPGSSRSRTVWAKARTYPSSARGGMLNHGSASRSLASCTICSIETPLTFGSLDEPPGPELCRAASAGRASATVRTPELFVSCQAMKRIAAKGSRRSRKSGWNGENAAPGFHTSPAKLFPFQSGIHTWIPRTGSAGSVDSMRTRIPALVGVTASSARWIPSGPVDVESTRASNPKLTVPFPCHWA